MRIIAEFSFEDKLLLPIHHNNIVQGFIYSHISDKIFRQFLHETGFEYEKRNFKLFTFSRILGDFRIDHKEGIMAFKSPIKLVVSSNVDNIINDFGSTIIKESDLRLEKNSIQLEKLETYENKNIENKIKVTMLSPVLTYSTVTIHNKKKTIYHKPDDGVFSKLLYENLKKKYKAVFGKEAPNEDFQFKPVHPNKMKQNIINYKGIIIKGWSGDFVMEGHPQLIKLAYDVGLGSKNSQGFGCFEIVK